MGASTSTSTPKNDFKSEEKSTLKNDFKSGSASTAKNKFKSERKYEIPCVIIEEPVITGLHWENPDLTDLFTKRTRRTVYGKIDTIISRR